MATQRIIVCAALRKDGVTICGARHCDGVMRSVIEAAHWSYKGQEQGFIDQYGVFVDRKEAWKIARAAGQIRRRTGWEQYYSQQPEDLEEDGLLFSENLY